MKLAFLSILTILSFFLINDRSEFEIEPKVLAQNKEKIEIRDDFEKFYKEHKTDGSFIFYDSKNDKLVLYNQKQYNEKFLPASTFKICNSLIGLETGVIPDENYVVKWDGKKRGREVWDQDLDLKLAFKYSAVWYYQELAKRVGEKKMQEWIDKVNFGNRNISGGIDRFWLTGGLRITPKQQLDFFKNLHNNKLPFTQRSMDIVKKIMVVKKDSSYTVHAKTGWAVQGRNTGWYVGYIETKDNTYYFVNCLHQKDTKDDNFGMARILITNKILQVIEPDKNWDVSTEAFPDPSRRNK